MNLFLTGLAIWLEVFANEQSTLASPTERPPLMCITNYLPFFPFCMRLCRLCMFELSNLKNGVAMRSAFPRFIPFLALLICNLAFAGNPDTSTSNTLPQQVSDAKKVYVDNREGSD